MALLQARQVLALGVGARFGADKAAWSGGRGMDGVKVVSLSSK